MADFDWENNVCFVCGSDVRGLHWRFSGDASQVRAQGSVPEPYQGFQGVVHGGILAGILDDAMWHVIHQKDDLYPMTAELTVRYLQPVAINQPLVVTGQIISYRRRLMEAEASITDESGQILVRARGRFMVPKKEVYEGA